ncbi:MAG: hypothetical protein LBS69_12240 [Prevotellaceae bacterium]|jgi:hypothetical protein|nr:hypothetical protein [Prevotellaceae bacterium]
MKKITLKIDDKIELGCAMYFARLCVSDFEKNKYKNCLYTEKQKQCFVKRTKAGNITVGVYEYENN